MYTRLLFITLLACAVSSVGLGQLNYGSLQWVDASWGSGFTVPSWWAPDYSWLSVPQTQTLSIGLDQGVGLTGGPGSASLGLSGWAVGTQTASPLDVTATQSALVVGSQYGEISSPAGAVGTLNLNMNVSISQVQSWE